MNIKLIGYCRVSTREQNERRQVISMREFGVPEENILVEKMSGKDFNRPVYRKLVEKLQPGDVLVIKSLDRLGRDYNAIMDEWRYITRELGAAIVVLDIPLLDTRKKDRDLTASFVADLVLQILSYVAEQERVFNHQRQAEGIAAAKARGVKFGRPAKKPPENFRRLMQDWERGELRTKDFMAQTGLSETTLYRRLRECKAASKK